MKKAFNIKNKMIAFAVTLYILAIVIAAVTGCPAFAVMPAIIVSAGLIMTLLLPTRRADLNPPYQSAARHSCLKATPMFQARSSGRLIFDRRRRNVSS